MEWIDVNNSKPVHGQMVRTLGADGREFDCGYWHWGNDKKPYFKLCGKVWHHDNVTHWKPLDYTPKS